MYRFVVTHLSKLNPFALLLILSLLSTPFQLPAQCCYQPEEEPDCCEDNSNFQNRALIIGGAAIAGGVIGAVIGNSNHHHPSSGSRGPSGSSGEPGPVGPVGPVGPGFANDPGQTLTFNLSVEILGDEHIFSAILTPFVTGPDGSTVEGTPVLLTNVIITDLEVPFAPISIDNPVFGQYQTGIQIAGNNFVPLPATLRGNVIATRDGSTTNLAEISFETPTFVQQLQGAMLFSYGQNNIP